MDIHKECYSAIDLTQQDGPHRRETRYSRLVHMIRLQTSGERRLPLRVVPPDEEREEPKKSHGRPKATVIRPGE
jgi:hypothetical protein